MRPRPMSTELVVPEVEGRDLEGVGGGRRVEDMAEGV